MGHEVYFPMWLLPLSGFEFMSEPFPQMIGPENECPPALREALPIHNCRASIYCKIEGCCFFTQYSKL